MAYVKTVWEDNKTPLDAANLNKIEEGIENAMSLAETNEKDIGTLDGQVAAIEVGKQDALTAGEGISISDNVAKISDNVARTSLTDLGNWVPVQHRPAAEPYWEDVKVSDSALANSIAQRNEQGQILTGAPTQDGMAANKKYVDDANATKQDKLTAGAGIEITSSNVVNVQESTMSTTHMPIGASFEADGIHTTKTLFADSWDGGNGAYLAQTFEDVTPIVAGDGIAFNKQGDKSQMQPEYFDVAVNKDAVPYFPSLDKNKYSLLSWDKAKQDWLTVDFSTEPSALSVARRTTTGQIKCEAPTENKAAVNKVYADSNYALCKKAQSEGGTLNLTTTLSIYSCATIEFVGHGLNAQGVGSFHIHIGNTYVLQLTAADGEFWVGGTIHILQNVDKAVAIGKYVDINLDEHEIKVEIERQAGSVETAIEIVGDAGAPADAGSVMLTYSYPGASSVVNAVTNEME